MKEIKQPMYQCEICGKVAKNRETIERCEAKHNCKHEDCNYYFDLYNSEEFIMKCKICNKRFSKGLKYDVEWHEFIRGLPEYIIKQIYEYLGTEEDGL